MSCWGGEIEIFGFRELGRDLGMSSAESIAVPNIATMEKAGLGV